ncbi:hypothetical protein TNCV_3686991 [Trichonephila clavipes]|nr:hypothetical protein TNCV_3686991 [Trichonephila clavipes]
MHVKHVDVKSPHVGVCGSLEGELSAQSVVCYISLFFSDNLRGWNRHNSTKRTIDGIQMFECRSILSLPLTYGHVLTCMNVGVSYKLMSRNNSNLSSLSDEDDCQSIKKTEMDDGNEV